MKKYNRFLTSKHEKNIDFGFTMRKTFLSVIIIFHLVIISIYQASLFGFFIHKMKSKIVIINQLNNYNEEN